MSEKTGFDEISAGLYGLQRLLSSRRVSSRLAEAAEVSVTQQGLQILRALRDTEQLPVAEVARAARMDLGAVSRQLRVLEDLDLVTRLHSQENRSVVLIGLTTKGNELAGRIARVTNQHLHESLAGWTNREREQLGELLLRLVHDLQRTPYRNGR